MLSTFAKVIVIPVAGVTPRPKTVPSGLAASTKRMRSKSMGVVTDSEVVAPV